MGYELSGIASAALRPMSCTGESVARALPVAGKEERKFWKENESLAKLISRMRKLPTLPALYVEMQNELAKPEVAIERLGELIAKDVGLTAKILRLVNSAVFGLSVKLCSAAEAVVYM